MIFMARSEMIVYPRLIRTSAQPTGMVIHVGNDGNRLVMLTNIGKEAVVS